MCFVSAITHRPLPSHPTTHAGGGFTNVDPESRRIVPEVNGRTKIKVGACGWLAGWLAGC